MDVQEASREQKSNDCRGRGPYSGVDAILSLRYETRPFWSLLQPEFGVSETAAAVILDIYAEALTKGRWTSYSRSKGHYARHAKHLKATGRKWQLRDGLYGYEKILAAVEELEAAGLIDHRKANPGSLGWQSSMRATPELIDRTRHLVRSGMAFVPARPSSTVVLRDAAGEQMAIRETAQTRRMSKTVEALNEDHRSLRLEGTFPGGFVRIHNEVMGRGGRFYIEGGGVQIMSEAERLKVLFDGEPAGEVDWKCMHVAMLYLLKGLTPPEDAYAIDGWRRNLVKIALLILINAPTFGSAMYAIAHSDEMKPMAKPGTLKAKKLAACLIDDLKRYHRPIEASFHSGAGAYLMRKESDIMEDVMMRLRKKGILVLPVHDSALGPRSKQGLLMEAMDDAAAVAGLPSLRLEAA